MVKGILEMFSYAKSQTVDISCEAYLKDGGMADCVVRVSKYVDTNEEDMIIEVSFGVGKMVEIDSDNKSIEKIVNICEYELNKIERAMISEFGSGYSVVTEEEIIIL